MSKKQIAVLGSMHVCPMCNGTVPHVGGPVASTSNPGVTINGQPVAVVGDMCTCSGPPDTIVQGCPGVLINGKPVAVVGSMTAHGGQIVQGIPGVTITTNQPETKSTLPIKDIPFPKVKRIDVLGARIKGKAQELKQAQQNIEQIKKDSIEQHGEENQEEEKQLPKLQGEIIFVNGYLSSSMGGVLNAIFDVDTDSEKVVAFSRGHNVDEENRTNDDDILTAEELEAINNMTNAETEANRKEKALIITYPTLKTKEVIVPFPIGISPVSPLVPLKVKVPTIERDTSYIDIPKDLKPIPSLTLTEMKETFYGYWNQVGNRYNASKTYAEYFNATGREHFINGSHGLGSNAAHRLDHGIALGYHWAKYNWRIKTKKEVEAEKEDNPQIESYSPAYKPVTIIMHSQGNAPGAGVALGVLKYAKEQGWDKVPLNLIYLGVHQPKNLCDKEYEEFINAKVKYYGVNKNFWDGKVWSPALKKDKQALKFMNAISELFDPKYHKLHNKRGIYEHLKALGAFEELQKRAVQFTFSNDRGDLVIRDGDIPEIDSACNPKKDSTLYSVEFFKDKAPEKYKSEQGKDIVPIKEGGELVVPSHAAVPRIHAIEDPSVEGGVRKEFWEDYKSVATDWGCAISKFKQLAKEYKFKWEDLFIPGKSLYKQVKPYLIHKEMLYHYGRIQEADLYAHFSPVEFILDEDILKHPDFDDELGQESIWDRIKKLGESKFYKVDYGKNSIFKTDEEKREKAKKYIEDSKNNNKWTPTSIADTSYINNVIKAYVKGDFSAEEKLYKEPPVNLEQADMEHIMKVLGQDAQRQVKQQLLDDIVVRQDKTRVDIPKVLK